MPAGTRERIGHRINVVGTTGCGKTTFAKALAERLGVPCIEIDALFWRPGWEQTPDEEFLPLVDQVTKGDCWVLDGNYSRTRGITWLRAETIIWLDYSFPRVFVRLLRRTFRRAASQEELWDGCRERFRTSFLSRDSILLWCLKTYWRRRANYPKLLTSPEHAHLQFVRLNTPRRAQRWLETIRNADDPENETGGGSNVHICCAGIGRNANGDRGGNRTVGSGRHRTCNCGDDIWQDCG